MVHTELVVAKLVTMGLGFLIAFRAFQGYRRYRSRPMLFVSVGFLFISFGAVVEGLLFEVAGVGIFEAGAIATATVAIGMLFVLYSLHGRLGVED